MLKFKVDEKSGERIVVVAEGEDEWSEYDLSANMLSGHQIFHSAHEEVQITVIQCCIEKKSEIVKQPATYDNFYSHCHLLVIWDDSEVSFHTVQRVCRPDIASIEQNLNEMIGELQLLLGDVEI